jgi:hypothetical protein
VIEQNRRADDHQHQPGQHPGPRVKNAVLAAVHALVDALVDPVVQILAELIWIEFVFVSHSALPSFVHRKSNSRARSAPNSLY